ncbi:MAG: amidohydrolase family protein, partial [Acidobacteriota bacterium]|nr:amidohydrolase family protein [Acidobacteriota bacterium]
IYTADGTRAGEQVADHGDNGLVKVHFVFKDNGRGPELDEEYRLAPDGTYAEYRVKGTSTYGAKVDEKFTRTGDRAVWASTSERGEKRVSGPAMYVPLNGTIDANSVSIAATAKAPGGRLLLLPAGTLTQRRLDEAEVTRPGKSQRVQLYAQTGQGLTPSFFWVTAGEKPRVFAFIYPGYIAAIEEGWDDNRGALEARQKKAEAAMLEEMAGRLMKPLDGLTVVRNVRVFDSEKAVLGPASNVYVLRGRISAVTPADAPVRGADREIDAAGRVLLPGLFDMHSHSDRWQGGLNIAAGVTTTRDMGGDNTTVQQIIDETESGRLLGPHIVPAGFLEGDGPNAARGGFVVKSLPEAKDAVDWYAEHGYPQLKIYNSFPRELVRDTVAYAHSRGMRVGGHVPAFLRAQEVVEQGFDEIQHINQVLLNFFVTPTTDTRTLERFYLVAEKTAGLDFDSKPVQDFIALLQKQPTVIDTTLGTFDFLRQRDGDVPQLLAAVFEHLPIDVQRGRRVGQMKIPDAATAARYEKSYAKMIEFVGRLYRAGVPLVAGTDEMAGFVLQRELELYVQAGLTPSQALQIATWNAAKYSRTLSDRGTIEPGKRADLVLIDGDPTKNIADIRRVALVITQGKIAVPGEIDRELGIAPFVDAGAVPRVVDLRKKAGTADSAR